MSFTFKQLCEYATCNQRYSWFRLPIDDWSKLDEEEMLLVYKERQTEDEVRLWYPREKFYARHIDTLEINRLLLQAGLNNDWEAVRKLRMRRDELTKK